MKRNLLPLGSIAFALVCGVVGWTDSYPVALHSQDDLLWNHVSPWYWIGIGLANLSLALSFVLQVGPKLSGAAAIANALAWSAPDYLFVIAGSDTPGVLGLAEVWRSSGLIDPEFHEYYQWPSTFLILGTLQSMTGFAMPVAGHLLFASIAAATGLALFWFFGGDHLAAAASGVFFTITAPFLNWQLAPQVLAFVVLVVLIRLADRPKTLPAVSTSICLFIFLCFTHPFVSLWFVAYSLLARFAAAVKVRSSSDAAQRSTLPGLISPMLLMAVQATVVVYVGTSLVLSIGEAIARIGAALESGGSLLTATSLTEIGRASTTPTYLVAIGLSGIAALTAGIVIVSGVLIAVHTRDFQPRSVALFVVGSGHYFAGLVGPFLGGRGLQIAALPLPGAIRKATTGRTKVAGAARFFVATSLVLSLAPIMAGARFHTQYLSESHLAAATASGPHLESGDHVFAQSVLVSYVALKATRGVFVVNPHYATEFLLYDPATLPKVVIWSLELDIEMRSLTSIDAEAYYAFVREHYRRVFTQKLTEVWVLADTNRS